MTIRDMVARHSDFDETRDFIPTPPYATRALYEYVAPELKELAPLTSFLDPAAGRGHMMLVAHEYGHKEVLGSDILPVPEAGIVQGDFTAETRPHHKADVIVTNPPYALLEEFIREGLNAAQVAFALLVRVQALETQGRYNKFFETTPPTQIAFFSDRIPFKTGEVVRKAPKMFFHTWLYWGTASMRLHKHQPRPPLWIPPHAQTLLEKESDYE